MAGFEKGTKGFVPPKPQMTNPAGYGGPAPYTGPPIKATPDPTYDGGVKDYNPQPSRSERQSFGLNEGDQE